MSNADIAISLVIAAEGGYINDPLDPGGETKYGISKREFPTIDIANLSVEDAVELYKKNYWDKYRVSEVQDQNIANYVLDMLVNPGYGVSVKIIQGYFKNLIQDGVMGTDTMLEINKIPNAQCFLNYLKVERIRYYLHITMSDKNRYSGNFLGWVKRALR